MDDNLEFHPIRLSITKTLNMFMTHGQYYQKRISLFIIIIYSIFYLPTNLSTYLPTYLGNNPLSRGPSCQLRPNRASEVLLATLNRTERSGRPVVYSSGARVRRCRSGLFSLLPDYPASLPGIVPSLSQDLSLSLCLPAWLPAQRFAPPWASLSAYSFCCFPLS